jgi:hypothetical protein
METKDIVILVACLAAAGISLYRKYSAKNKTAPGDGGTRGKSTSMPAGKDDYEPYSGK